MKGSNKEKLYEALLSVKPEYTAEAERFEFKKRRFSLPRIIGAVAAACLVTALAAVAVIPKGERGQWAANAGENGTTAPETAGVTPPAQTEVPTLSLFTPGCNPPTPEPSATECVLPRPHELEIANSLITFSYPTGLTEFFISQSFNEEEFGEYASKTGLEQQGIRTPADAQSVIELMRGIPFPSSEEYDLISVSFLNHPEGEYAYDVIYYVPGGGSLIFNGRLAGEDTLDGMLNVITGESEVFQMNVDGNAHISRLFRAEDMSFNEHYFGNEETSLGFHAEVDGKYMQIASYGLSEQEAVKAINRFDFRDVFDAAPVIVPVETDLGQISLSGSAEIKLLLDACALTEEEFARLTDAGWPASAELTEPLASLAQFMAQKKLAENRIRKKTDLETIVNNFDSRRFPVIDGWALESIELVYKINHSTVNYVSPDGKACTFYVYADSFLATPLKTLAWGMTQSEPETVPLGKDSPFESLFRLRGPYPQAADVYVGMMPGFLVTFSLAPEDAAGVIDSLSLATLGELAENGEGAEPHGTEECIGVYDAEFFSNAELYEFVRAASGTDAEFNAYLGANRERFYGIDSRADALALLELLDSMPFAHAPEGGFSRLFISAGIAGNEKDVASVHYEFDNRVWVFSNYFRDKDENGARDTLDELIAALELRPIAADGAGGLQRLFEYHPKSGDTDELTHFYYAEADGKYFEIDTINLSGDDAVRGLERFEFGRLSELADR